jgi:demethylmenaquinone methyltransferase/2-methoxy-6-polyprenyl-1,4-benzoquinol methylase
MARQPDGFDKPAAVRRMFGAIAGRYDVMNALMTFGQDDRWRRIAVCRAGLPHGGRLLDVGAGTGGLSLAALTLDPAARVTAVDFAAPMMHRGRRRLQGRPIAWCAADALRLPFGDACFDAVVSGYLLRNVADIGQALAEQVRVVKPGGRVVCLDTCPPSQGLFHPLAMVHLRWIIPWLGRVVAGDGAAYRYLPESTMGFIAPPQMAAAMQAAGLIAVTHQRLMLGTVAIHVGRRPERPG